MAAFMKELEYLKIQLEHIKLATYNFSDNKVIGKGGFGKVYKGYVMHSKGISMVALKRLDRKYGQGDSEFMKELMFLSRYKHENLISLLGFSNEGDEKILVYEYASRGSLDCHLSDATLTWKQRVKICLAAAKGLSCLHDSNPTPHRVVHCDIKSSNILLDDNWNAKLSDFGLSKICPANQDSFLITNPVGTPGYCDPCYMETYTLTKESDIYSFGVVLLEVLFGRLCYEHVNGPLQVLVPMWKQKYEEENLDEIIFHDLKQQMASRSLKSFVDIAYQCLEKSHKKRPTIACVIEELETALQSQELYEHVKQSPPHHEDTTSTKICATCKNEIGSQQAYLIRMGEVWHEECLSCHFCSKPITGYEFSMSRNYPYHKACYKQHRHPKCNVCQHFIPRNSAGRLAYKIHPFWAQKSCRSHKHDGTPWCCSCKRLESRERRYAALDDGRKVCPDCFDSSIMNTKDCQQLYLDIQAFYESLNMKFEQKIPITLVNKQELYERTYGKRNDHDMTKVKRVSCIWDMTTEPYNLEGFLILYGYPRLLTGIILSGLMMLAWMQQQGYPELNEDVEMGIRQVLAHMWLRSQVDLISSRYTSSSYSATSSTQSKSSVFDKLFVEFLKFQIESHEVYGNCFRVANQAVLKYGLPTTLDHIRLTGSFPE